MHSFLGMETVRKLESIALTKVKEQHTCTLHYTGSSFLLGCAFIFVTPTNLSLFEVYFRGTCFHGVHTRMHRTPAVVNYLVRLYQVIRKERGEWVEGLLLSLAFVWYFFSLLHILFNLY